MTNKIQQLQQIIQHSENIVFFGGAGVSTESNIPDFRSSEGIYTIKQEYSYPPEVMLSHSFFIRHTKEFFDFYKEKMIYPNAKPNAAHHALAALEKQGKLRAVITQNIDGLHQLAGSQKVLELHGSVHRNYCTHCNTYYDLDFILKSSGVPKCTLCGNIVKPDVVLYEEGLDTNTIEESLDYIAHADVLIIGGTSLTVYPAAGLINYYRGNQLILINRDATTQDHRASITFTENIGVVLSSVIQH